MVAAGAPGAALSRPLRAEPGAFLRRAGASRRDLRPEGPANRQQQGRVHGERAPDGGRRPGRGRRGAGPAAGDGQGRGSLPSRGSPSPRLRAGPAEEGRRQGRDHSGGGAAARPSRGDSSGRAGARLPARYRRRAPARLRGRGHRGGAAREARLPGRRPDWQDRGRAHLRRRASRRAGPPSGGGGCRRPARARAEPGARTSRSLVGPQHRLYPPEGGRGWPPREERSRRGHGSKERGCARACERPYLQPRGFLRWYQPG